MVREGLPERVTPAPSPGGADQQVLRQRCLQEGSCRWVWETHGGRCGWSWGGGEVGPGGHSWERGREGRPLRAPGHSRFVKQEPLETWGGAGEGTPPQRWAFQQRMQVSQRAQKGALGSTVNFLLDYHIWSLQLIILGETKDLAFHGYGEQRGHRHFVYFVAQHTQKSLKDLPTVINWNNGGERARGQASSFKPCGTHLTGAPSKGGRALPREASPPPRPPVPAQEGLRGAAAWDRVLSSPQDSEWEPRASGGWERANTRRGSALWTAEGC